MIYDEYISLRKLLDCNKPQADSKYALEESFFIRVHHIHEINFAQILADVNELDSKLSIDSEEEKIDRLQRILACWKLNIGALKLLEYLKREDFLGFRPSLTGISGISTIKDYFILDLFVGFYEEEFIT